MVSLAKGDGDRTVNDAERWLRNWRARTMTSSVEEPMSSTSLRSRTSPALSRAMARASVRHSALSVETSCSPQSRTTMGRPSDPLGPRGGRSGRVKKEDPAVAMAFPTSGATKAAYQGLEYRPEPANTWPNTSSTLTCDDDGTPPAVACAARKRPSHPRQRTSGPSASWPHRARYNPEFSAGDMGPRRLYTGRPTGHRSLGVEIDRFR